MLTEALHHRATGLDTLCDAEVLQVLLDGQKAALDSVTQAIPDIARGADLMATALRGTGRLIYAAAGSSALMGNADGLELAGTFGTDPARVRLCMAGGLPQDATMPGDTEDDTTQAENDAADLTALDVLIAITASGRTPYAMRMAELAQKAGAKTICVANNPGAPIFEFADVAICLATPPEVISGSTRMGAGTAQKAALNMMSTLMGIRLGHVLDGQMVNLRADNDKLRNRAQTIVSRITGAPDDTARAALDQADGSVKLAILIARGAASTQEANTLLTAAKGDLRRALGNPKTPETIGAEFQTSMEKKT
jgi:N-acetylmuramic acid 6-phosphate etherase